MAAKILIKWIRKYRRSKDKKASTSLMKSFDGIQHRITSRLNNEISKLHEIENDKENEELPNSNILENLDIENTIQKPDEMPHSRELARYDSRITEECKNFIENNPEYFNSIKRDTIDSKEIKNLKVSNAIKITKNKKQFNTDPGSQSFVRKAIGGYFNNEKEMQERRINYDIRNKHMRSTNAFVAKKNIKVIDSQEGKPNFKSLHNNIWT